MLGHHKTEFGPPRGRVIVPVCFSFIKLVPQPVVHQVSLADLVVIES